MVCPAQIVLQQTRTIIHELKKSETFRSNNTEEGKALSTLKDLQLKTRCDLKAVLNLSEVINPFLNLLRINSISGPYKLLALRSIQIFLECNLFQIRSSANEQALTQIIVSIINCKFVQTEAKFDDTVQLQMLQTLNKLVVHVDYVVCITESNDIVQFCLNFLARSTVEMHSTAHHELALATVHNIVRGTVTFVRKGGDLSLATAVNVMSFIATQFRRYIGTSTFNVPQDDEPPLASTFDAGTDVGFSLALNLFRTFTAELQLQGSAMSYFLRDEDFAFYFQQELPFCMISLGTLQLSAELLNEILVVFTTITCICGDVMKYFTEHFIRQVYLKHLRTICDLLHQQVGETHPLAGKRVPPHELVYNIEALEIVAESACDLLAQVEFLPTLFGNFDCSTYESDLLRPFVELVSSCTSIVLTSGTERLGSLKELGVLIVQCFKQIIHSVVQRRVIADQYFPSNASDAVVHSKVEQQKQIGRLVAKERKRKVALRLATKKFSEKPTSAFLYMQQNDLLPTPATAESVARFLRFTPNLPKDCVGSFLGELGKTDAKFEWETVDFHRQLLLRYVESFKLEGLSVLNCLRLFLSAFRLPGEAQQIDRILVAFSERCHSSSCESKTGVLENSEVTYLLTFSIIMLNTDRHNPNIRAERKMTMEQFVRNNKFYGKDVNQTMPIPQEYLEDIFRCIDKNQIRTETNEENAVLTEEEWMDVQMRVRANKLENAMFATNSSLLKLGLFDTALLKDYSSNFLFSDMNLHDLLTVIDGHHWVWDEDMLECLEPYLLYPGICVHLYNRVVVQELSRQERFSPSNESKETNHVVFWKERTGRLMDLSGDFLMEFLNVCSRTNLQRTIDLVILLFTEIIGLKVPDMIERLVENATDSASTSTKIADSDPYPKEKCFSMPLFLSNLNFISTQRSLLLLLEIILSFSHSIQHWEIVLFLLASLRDFSLLPGEFFVDKDEDLLPPNLREEFDLRMLEKDKESFATITLAELRDNTSSIPNSPSTLQLLGEALFGSSEKVSSGSSPQKNIDGTIDNFLSSLDGFSSRWNEHLLTARKSFPALKRLTEVFTYLNDSAIRASIAKTNIANLISESKYLPEKQLHALLTAITHLIENKMGLTHANDISIDFDYENSVPADRGPKLTCDNHLSGIYAVADKFYASNLVSRCFITTASASWLETVLTEICLRNRDRFQLCWGIMKHHYLKTVGDVNCKVSYIAERQLNGIFKICGRMLSRDNYVGILIELLQRLFRVSHRNIGKVSVLEPKNSTNSEDDLAVTSNHAKHEAIDELTNQIAAGMWRILTQNIEVLPLLSLEQWEIIFSIVAFGSSRTNFAAFKSFEILAWLLHEPRLIASVPVFCIFAIKPLIRNSNASEFVSTGAIKLLMYLHSRLESIALNLLGNKPNSNALAEDEMIDIWKKCWFPILQALAEGIVDSRIAIRNACVASLCEAVRDKHIDAVPPSVLIDVVVHLLIPVIEITNGIHGKNDSSTEEHTIGETIRLETLDTLNILFSKCLNKVREYPSFDKVWFQVIDLLTTLSSPENNTRLAFTSQLISDKAKQVLKAIIVEANEAKLFSRRKDLMLVTKNCLQGLPELEGILQ